MAIVCPYCDHRLTLKAAKPGRFRPKCPRCEKPFLLWVPDAPGSAPQARALSAEARSDSSVPVFALALSANGGTEPAPSGAASAFEFTNPGPARTPSDDAPLPPRTEVRGYAIERELGRGGMGTVYLATQLSLDRHVALKVMSKRWATDPVFVARFTREAFAAAQLSHPNIVQIHDIGEADGARFFSMEYVRGRSLADVLRTEGKLDPDTAVGYVLQAARGLKHAHDRGMIHRDVKPDNLLLDTNGLLKVADLGLVKTPAAEPGTRNGEPGVEGHRTAAPGADPRPALPIPHSNLTGHRIALGTPAYMSPEQCRDAATVDHRADIYSLGCTLYVLVTGKPPFDGTTAVELMSKHAYDPLVPPEQIVSRVPKEISSVIQRMMAKDAGDRYQDMGEVVRTLEAWLGVHHTGTFSPQEEQISRLEGAVAAFNTCPAAVLRGRLVQGFFGAVALVAVLLAFFGRIPWAFGTFALALETALAYFVLDGVTRRGHLFTCTRRFLGGLGWADWVVGLSALTMFLVLLALLKVFWMWAGFGVIGIGLAFALRYGVDRALARQRRAVLDGAERQLRRMRARGLDEDELRQFVAKFAGREWEEFFEALFGYEAKLSARAVLLRGGAAGARDKHAAWREPLIATMERIEKGRQEARARKLLLAVERANLLAAGESLQSADDHARAAAEAMVRAADQIQRAEGRGEASAGRGRSGPANVRALVTAAERPNDFVPAPERPTSDPLGNLIGLFVGPHVRAVGAAVLIAACALWAHQNGLLPGPEVQEQAARAVEAKDWSGLQKQAALDAGRATRPLAVPVVPAKVTAWVDGFNVGLAGLVLLASLCFRGNLMSVFVLLGAAVMVVGHQAGIRTVEPFRESHVSLMLGAVLALVGFRVGTR